MHEPPKRPNSTLTLVLWVVAGTGVGVLGGAALGTVLSIVLPVQQPGHEFRVFAYFWTGAQVGLILGLVLGVVLGVRDTRR